MNGTFIVFEGPDGSGTTLHARLLAERLRQEGAPVLSTFEPTEGPIGTKIRQMLHSGETLSPAALQELFCKDRAWHLQTVVKPALAQGSVVISDRYSESTLAYGETQELDLEWLKNMNKDFIQEECLFYLLPPFKVCAERMGRREKHDALEEAGFQRQVYDVYKRMAEEDPSCHIIDTSGAKEEVADTIYEIVHQCLRTR